MKVVGYMEGTNPHLLTSVILEGFETLPLSNGWDNHGKHLTLLNPADNISVVVGNLYKFVRLDDESIMSAMLATVKAYDIPVVFVVEKEWQAAAKKLINDKDLKYVMADPKELKDIVMKYLKG
jgi:hypothetical protein